LKSNNFKKDIELLAPANNCDTGVAAINCGADAVYIGGSKFGARASASNDLNSIEKLVNYAHKYRAKIYVTINTILDDREIEQAQRLIYDVYNIGVDAVIIQDMGLLECDLPPIPLHASTQAHNFNWQKVDFLEKVGFHRVILARDLSLKQIQEIRQHTSVELEAFIHGALCVCYSGQCYLSYAIGGRSGNRGECAQPCRKKYSLIDSKGRQIADKAYLLSLKDLNLSEYLEQMLDSGISSFKIEGRLKDENYVKNVVSFYRQKLDSILENKDLKRSSLGNSFISFSPNVDKTFNRGYSTYFITGKSDNITSFKTPKSKGESLGKVVEVKNKAFKLSSKLPLHNGDGISFFDNSGELKGSYINKVENSWIYPYCMDGISKGVEIFRNYDKEFLDTLERSKVERKIPVEICVDQEESYLIFKAIDPEGIVAEIKIDNTFELAQNEQKSKENIEKQLSKLGSTEFQAQNININLDNIYFIPVSELNNIRRQLIEQLVINREKAYTGYKISIIRNTYPYFETKLDYRANVMNQKAKEFYNRHGAEVVEMAAETGLDMANKVVMTTKHCLKREFGLCKKQNVSLKVVEPLFLVDEYDKKYKLCFDCDKCEMKILF